MELFKWNNLLGVIKVNRRFVAFIDILGFKGIVETYKGRIDELGKKLSEIFTSAIYAAVKGEDTKVGDIPKDLPDDISFYQFSDSVILYTKDGSSRSRDTIINALNYLLARSAIQGFPLRGGLVKEELYVNPPVLVGEGIIKAYSLEMKQEWSGVIVDEDCYPLLEDKKVDLENKLIATASVPVKIRNGEKIIFCNEGHLVINWPEFVGNLVSNKDDFKECFIKETGMPIEEKDKTKLENTLKFFENHVGFSKLPSLVFIGALLRGGKYFIENQKNKASSHTRM